MSNKKDDFILKDMFSLNNNTMSTAQLNAKNLYHRDIQKMLDNNLIEKVKRGYYHWIDDNESEITIINRLFPDAILCMETALFYYNYSDRTPSAWNIAINKNASRGRTKLEYPFVKAYRMEPDLLNIGETKGKIDNTDVRIYNRDRTICDVLKNMNKMDKEIFNKAVQGYIIDNQKNIPNLMTYSKTMRLQKKVNDIIGVWL